MRREGERKRERKRKKSENIMVTDDFFLGQFRNISKLRMMLVAE